MEDVLVQVYEPGFIPSFRNDLESFDWPNRVLVRHSCTELLCGGSDHQQLQPISFSLKELIAMDI